MSSAEPTRAAGAGVKWRAAAADDVRWAEVGADFVAYHRPSGKTHLLNAASAALLTEILVRPLDAGSAADALAALQSTHGDADFTARVGRLLERLEELGLVERA